MHMLEFISDPGCNWLGDINKLKELALESKNVGCTVFKPQIFDASQLYKSENNPCWEVQKACSMKINQVQEIYDYCKSIKIDCMFSCFNSGHLRWLEEVGCSKLKIPARMAGDNEFVSEASSYGFEVYVSFSPEHKHFSYWEYKDLCTNPKFMYCRSIYPCRITDYDLKQSEVLGGISDHTTDTILSMCAIARGANVIERHVYATFYMDMMKSPDFICSIPMNGLKYLIDNGKLIEHIR